MVYKNGRSLFVLKAVRMAYVTDKQRPHKVGICRFTIVTSSKLLTFSRQSNKSQTRIIQYVLLFIVGKRRGVIKPLPVQRYNKFLIYANLFTKYSRTRIELREKDEETRSPKERAQDTYLAGHRQALNQKEEKNSEKRARACVCQKKVVSLQPDLENNTNYIL